MNFRSIAAQSAILKLPRVRQGRFRISYHAIGQFVAVSEAFMIMTGSVFGSRAYALAAGVGPGELDTTLGTGLLSCILYLALASSAGLYRLPALLAPVSSLKRLVSTCFTVLFSVTAVIFVLKLGPAFSRGAFIAFFSLVLILCGLTRFAAVKFIDALIRSHVVKGRPAFLVGEPDELVELSASYLLRRFGLEEVGRLIIGGTPHSKPDTAALRADDAIELSRRLGAREFILALRLDDAGALPNIEKSLRASPLPVRLLPDRALRTIVERHSLFDQPHISLIELQRAPLGLWERSTKRMVDIIASSVSMLLLAPILVLAALAIRMDSPGPIIFKQRRKGFDQQPFTIFKFRTMTVMEDGADIKQARPNDSRITRVGKFLRRSSIDELPQLLNVLFGDMSLVGPRPHAIAHDEYYSRLIGDYCLRHHVKPGITGWAQVHGLRGSTSKTEDMERRVKLDIDYINNWSLFLDFRILARTCFEIVKLDAY